ncbi:uncharacterized protein LOC124137865 [Haliotis rufescens]|uniref:uncharacterized protein LOC124137865 n=1 Tax=Haliotis rufescens TaxID=6454 RepID=UPI00201F05AD|nr:uncharacterized protein LOC124137865 [Haliotis rufescens]
MVVDKERYEGYLKLNDSFTCIQGFTNILAVTPEMELKRPAKVCLPLDLHAKGDNSEVLFVHWKESEEDRGAEVICNLPKEEPKNSYSVDVTSFSSYAPVCVPKKTSLEDIATSVEFISGKRSMCNILTLSSYDTNYKMHRLLMDCVDFYKVNSVIERHQQDGMREIELSRSRDIQLKRKTRIKVSLEGNLTYLDKNLKVNSLKYDCYARTNKITMPVKSNGRSMSIVRYTWERENHQVFFFLDKQTLGSSSRSKAQHRKSSQSRSSTLTSRNVGNNGASSEENVSSTSPLDLHQRDVTGSQNHRLVHPVLSDKSLSALSDSLPQVVWRSMGLELNFTTDEICSIFEKAERRKSDPRFELLREWKSISRGTSESLINDLVAALEEIGRHDVAEMLRLAAGERREIRRNDFNGRAGRQKAVMRLPTVRDGHFIYPDVN